MEDGQTDHGNSECQYSSWMDISDVDSEESPSAQEMPPKPKTPSPAALYPQVQLSSDGASTLQKCQRQDSTSLEGDHNKKRKTKDNSANTTATSSVSLPSDVGHVGTQGASESREKARAHSKKLLNMMVTKTKHVDNPPLWENGTEEDFCNKKTFTRLAAYLSDVT